MQQPIYTSELDAKITLCNLLSQHFYLNIEVEILYPETQNILRIDYLAIPKKETEFQFPFFGIECKKAYNGIGDFNKALKQAIDYTKCRIIDKRFPNLHNKFLSEVYLFPTPQECCKVMSWHAGCERLAGLFHVGMIYLDRIGNPQFRMSATRQWDTEYGKSQINHSKHKVGTTNIKEISIINLGGFGSPTMK